MKLFLSQVVLKNQILHRVYVKSVSGEKHTNWDYVMYQLFISIPSWATVRICIIISYTVGIIIQTKRTY